MKADDLNLNEGSLRLLDYLVQQRFCTATIVIHEGQLVRAEQIKKIIQAKDFDTKQEATKSC